METSLSIDPRHFFRASKSIDVIAFCCDKCPPETHFFFVLATRRERDFCPAHLLQALSLDIWMPWDGRLDEVDGFSSFQHLLGCPWNLVTT